MRDILAVEFCWIDNAFSNPITSADELIETWAREIELQQNIRAECKILAKEKNKIIAQWNASYEVDDIKTELDGILYADF